MFHNTCSVSLVHRVVTVKSSNIRRIKSQNISASCLVLQLFLPNPLKPHVVGAAPAGAAPTTSEWSTNLLPTKVRLILEIWWCLSGGILIYQSWSYIFIQKQIWFSLHWVAYTLCILPPDKRRLLCVLPNTRWWICIWQLNLSRIHASIFTSYAIFFRNYHYETVKFYPSKTLHD